MIRNVQLIKEINLIARNRKMKLLRKGKTKYLCCCLNHHGSAVMTVLLKATRLWLLVYKNLRFQFIKNIL